MYRYISQTNPPNELLCKVINSLKVYFHLGHGLFQRLVLDIVRISLYEAFNRVNEARNCTNAPDDKN